MLRNMPRTMFRLTLIPLALLATPALADQLSCDGPFAADSSEARLVESFGRDNVVTGDIPGPEGSTILATTVFPTDPEKKMEFGWWDEENLTQLAYFTVPAKDTAPQGVKVGMDVKEVEALNGAPFDLQGFWWDYGGYANFTGGKLAAGDAGCMVSVRFAPEGEYPQDLNVDAISGEMTVPSSEPLLEQVGARVESVSVSYRDFASSED
jgi:hypothetical protein